MHKDPGEKILESNKRPSSTLDKASPLSDDKKRSNIMITTSQGLAHWVKVEVYLFLFG